MITIYGADWCEDTRRSMRHLRRLSVPHRYINIDEDLDALERAKTLNEGRRRTPTIDLQKAVLVEPTNRDLTTALIESGLLTREEAEERIGIQNVGDLDRVIRVGAGVLGLLVATRLPRVLAWPVTLAALGAALTGASGWCPVYQRAGMTSLEGPGDRPDEAHRREWLAPVDAIGSAPVSAEAVRP